MTSIEVPDWVVVKFIGEIGKAAGYPPYVDATTQRHFKDALTAALGAWVVEMGVEVRDPDGFVAMFSRDESEQLRIPRRDDDYKGSKTQPLFVLRQEKPE